MEKCPKCELWMLSFNRFRREVRCYNPNCDYVKQLSDREVELCKARTSSMAALPLNRKLKMIDIKESTEIGFDWGERFEKERITKIVENLNSFGVIFVSIIPYPLSAITYKISLNNHLLFEMVFVAPKEAWTYVPQRS